MSQKRQRKRSSGSGQRSRPSRAAQPVVAPAHARTGEATPQPTFELPPPPDLKHFVPNLLRAAGTEPREIRRVRGASGVSHDFVGLGVDDARHRVVLISDAADARGAAIAQSDVQAALSEQRVIVVRPVLVHIGRAAELVVAGAGGPVFTSEFFNSLPTAEKGATQEEITEQWGKLVAPAWKTVGEWVQHARGMGTFRWRPQVLEVLEQLARIKVRSEDESFSLDLSALLAPTRDDDDRALGVCGIPVYDMTEDELETINSGTNLDDIETILSRHGIQQFFFPPADHLALGLIDRGGELHATNITEAVEQSPQIGHPFGSLDLVPTGTSLTDLLDALKERELAIEGELGYELTPEGAALRASVRFQPRESLVSRIINRLNVKFDITFWKSG